MNVVRPWLRWLLALVFAAAGFWFLNLAAYHWWAAGGPPNPHPEFNRKWGNVFFFASITSFVFTGIWLWFTRKTRVAA